VSRNPGPREQVRHANWCRVAHPANSWSKLYSRGKDVTYIVHDPAVDTTYAIVRRVERTCAVSSR
jgi:hypothetical protein